MCTETVEHVRLTTFQKQLDAWHNHCIELGLTDRLDFMRWMADNLTAEELALAIDSELVREDLQAVYMREVYGMTG